MRNSVRYSATPMPTLSGSANPFFEQSGPFIGLTMCFALVYPLSRLVKSLVEDKESRSKEVMLIQNLRKWVWILSWWLVYALVFLTISILVTAMLVMSLLQHSVGLIVFLYFLLSSLSFLSLGFLLSTFFNKAKLAGMVAPILAFALVMPKYAFSTGAGQFKTNQRTAAMQQSLERLSLD